ncbi:MAG: hypothetical protein MZV70_76250 [Desulfobacterales bacterium]|nr:hypothetical protein [Desulfobacterales bacterium]
MGGVAVGRWVDWSIVFAALGPGRGHRRPASADPVRPADSRRCLSRAARKLAWPPRPQRPVEQCISLLDQPLPQPGDPQAGSIRCEWGLLAEFYRDCGEACRAEDCDPLAPRKREAKASGRDGSGASPRARRLFPGGKPLSR